MINYRINFIYYLCFYLLNKWVFIVQEIQIQIIYYA
jgi:hypothetical protein